MIVQRDKRIRHKFNNLDSLLAKFLEKALYVFPIQTYVNLWLASGDDHICFLNRHEITNLRGPHNDLLVWVSISSSKTIGYMGYQLSYQYTFGSTISVVSGGNPFAAASILIICWNKFSSGGHLGWRIAKILKWYHNRTIQGKFRFI